MWGLSGRSIDGFCAVESRRDLQERLEKRLRAAERLVVRGRISAAARRALEVAESPDAEPASLNRVGDLLVRARQVDRAVAVFERVARAYADDGFWAKAIAIYKKILRCDPRRRDVESQLELLYQRSGLPIEVVAGGPVPTLGLASRGFDSAAGAWGWKR